MLARKKIEWQFSTAKAPWHGPFFERCVQIFKRPLRRAVGTRCLKLRELEATLIEIEKVVNETPIAVTVSDPNEPRALSVGSALRPLQAGRVAQNGGNLEDGGERDVLYLLDEIQAAADYSENLLEEVSKRIFAAVAFSALSQAA